MMDELRPEDYDAPAHAFDDEDPDAGIEPDVIDRLAAYGHGSAGGPERDSAALMSTGPHDPRPEPAGEWKPRVDQASYAAHERPIEPDPEAQLEQDPVAPDDVEHDELAVESTGPDPADPAPVAVVAEQHRFGRRRNRGAPRRQPKEHDKRTKKLVGLKIGASQIAAAQIENNGAPELVEVVREPLEAGVVVSGEIRDPDALGDALKRFFELHKLPKRGVRLGLANNRIGVRVFEIEGVADAQLENAIRFRAEEVLPIPLDQAVLDYVVLGDEVRPDGTESKRILLVVAYREVVDRYLQACRRAGLQVVGIDLEAFALLRSLESPTERDATAGALVGVAIGHDRTTIAVSTGQYCEFARVLDWGGWSLNVAVARELDRAPSEVEAIKRQLSFARPTEIEGLTAEQVGKTRAGMQRALATFSRELVSSLQFYQAQPGALGIGEIVLTGGTSHMDGLTDAVRELVGVPVRQGDPFKRLKVGPRVRSDDQSGSLAVAIGLGIED
jgi:type IV pilus assembly protein PilM